MKLTRLHAADVLTFTLTGPEPQRALTMAAAHGIRLARIKALPKGLQADLAGVDWPHLQALLAGGPWTLTLQQEKGPGRLLERLTLRPGLPVGAAWAFLLTIILSRFVWTIDFGPLDADAQARLRQLLDGQNICEGTFLTQDVLARAQAAALQQSDRFGWISLNFTGGRLFVESTASEHQTIQAEPTQSALYAAAAGEITAIEADSGFCMVTVGQQVAAGDLLVDVQRLDRKGNPVLQGASGRVVARVEKSFESAQPYYTTQPVLTGRSYHAEHWQLLGREIHRENSPTACSGITEESWLPLQIGRVALPGVVQRTATWETADTTCHYSESTALALALRACRAQLYREFPDAVIEAERRHSKAGEEAASCTVTYIFCANIAKKP